MEVVEAEGAEGGNKNHQDADTVAEGKADIVDTGDTEVEAIVVVVAADSPTVGRTA